MSRPDEPARPRVPADLLAHLEQREHAAQAETDRLQEAIAELTEQLDHARHHLDRLAL